MSTLRRNLRRWGPPVLYVMLMFALSSRPTRPVTPEGGDKLIHLIEYAILGLLLVRAVGPMTWRHRLMLLVLGAGIGMTDEWIQSLVPGRDSSLLDVAADVLGVLTGIWLGSKGIVARQLTRWC